MIWEDNITVETIIKDASGNVLNEYPTEVGVYTIEYSTEYKLGMEPYYPVNDEKNNSLYQKYKELADKEDRVIFGGRLAEYKYYDMAPIVEKVLNMNI